MTNEYTLRGKSLSRIAEFIQEHKELIGVGYSTGEGIYELNNISEKALFTLIKDVVILELEKHSEVKDE